jgi:hypothetical protein
MSSNTAEQLQPAIEHLRTWASTKRVAWVAGLLSEARGELPTVHFAPPDDPLPPLASAEAFSRTLDGLDVGMLVVSIVILDDDTQQAAVALYEGDTDFLPGPDAKATRALVKNMLADARAARKYVGEPGSIIVSAITRNPTVVIVWSATADWYLPIEASELAYAEMEDIDVGPEPDDIDDGWEEIELPPQPPLPPRRRIPPRR